MSSSFLEPAALPKAPQALRLLLVEDEPRLRALICDLVQGSGREIFQCSTAAEAMKLLAAEPIDLALINIRLPGATGMDLMNWIRERGINLAVVVVSGDETIESALTALRCGAHEYIRKPFDPETLTRTVDDVLAARRQAQENRTATIRLEQSERLHRYLVDRSPDLIFALDANGKFSFVNARFTSLLGYESNELLGTHYASIVHDDDLRAARWACSERRSGRRASSNVEIRLRRRVSEGGEVGAPSIATVVISATGMYAEADDQGSPRRRFLGTYGVARDITDRKQAEQIGSIHATRDPLTGLPNRSLFRDRVDQAIARARRMFLHKGHVAVLFVDVDCFRKVNETYGHVRGDQLLQQIAGRLGRCLRGSDTLSRVGGGEFVALIPELSGREGAEATAEKIFSELRRPFVLGEREFRTSVSIGVAIYPDDGATEEELVRNADLARYEVKRQGRDGIGCFTPPMNAVWAQKQELENELQGAMESGALELHYQPVHNLGTGCVESLEALVRWRHPVHGLLDARRFIPAAVESGLIASLGGHVLEAACADLSRWRARGHRDLRVSVNVSTQEFERVDLVDFVISVLKHHAVPPQALELEITENALIDELDAVADRARRLRREGVRIAIDDFGTRYSTLGYLESLPVSGIKIDQSFVRDIEVRSSSATIVSAMVGIARGFGLSLVAEGVETQEQVALLRASGCDVMQGFFFSRPLPAAQMDDYLAKHAAAAPG